MQCVSKVRKNIKNAFTLLNKVYVTCIRFYHRNFSWRTIKDVSPCKYNEIVHYAWLHSFYKEIHIYYLLFFWFCFISYVDSIDELLLFRKKMK